MNSIEKFLALVSLAVINTLMAGFTLMKLWNWHIAPFLKVPEISGMIQAVGFALALKMFTDNPPIHTKQEDGSVVVKAGISFVYYLLALGFGYLWYVLR